MEKWQKEHLKVTLPQLIEDTDFTVKVENALTSENILSKEDVQKVRAEITNYAVASKLYSILETRTGAYRVLATAFYHERQSGALLILLKGLFLHLAAENSRKLDKTLLDNIIKEKILKSENWLILLEYLQPNPPLDLRWLDVLTSCQKRDRNKPIPAQSLEKQKRAGSESEDETVVRVTRGTSLSKRPRLEEAKVFLEEHSCSTSGEEGQGEPVLSSFIPGVPVSPAIDYTDAEQPLRIKITRPSQEMQFSDDHYGLPHTSKGLALIVNIRKFDNAALDRPGAEWDTEYMNNLWCQFGYEVYCTKEKFNGALAAFKKKMTKSVKSCVVFLGSHGVHNKIVTSDDQRVDVHQEVVTQFNHKNCKYLRKKPKIFLIQACQDFETEQTDSPPSIDDTMVCFATTPGEMARRNLFIGCRYTYCLSKVFMENAHKADFYSLLKMTQEELKNVHLKTKSMPAQLSTQFDMGIKKLYFNIAPVQNNQPPQ